MTNVASLTSPTGTRIAYIAEGAGGPKRAGVLWLSGFLSDMASTKASVLAEWAQAQGRPSLRFDYSAHGQSGGDIMQATIGGWLMESVAVYRQLVSWPCVLVGSSMGGWLALLLLRALTQMRDATPAAGLVLIAPAWDMTEALMWDEFPPEAREALEREGVVYNPSLYGDPYPITRLLIEEGRNHLLKDTTFDPGCPVRILHGMQDPDVPWRHSLPLLDMLTTDDIHLTLIKDGEHRLSRPQDLALLLRTVDALCGE